MSTLVTQFYHANEIDKLLSVYDKVMILKVFVNDPYDDKQLTYKYIQSAVSHNNNAVLNSSHIDAGFDLFLPQSQDTFEEHPKASKINFNVCCSATIKTDTGKQYNTGFYMHPRSSLSKTGIRLANSTGIIDAGYRGNIMGMFDVIDTNFECKKFDRYVQLCGPALIPMLVEIVYDKVELGCNTVRGEGGFGSTGA